MDRKPHQTDEKYLIGEGFYSGRHPNNGQVASATR